MCLGGNKVEQRESRRKDDKQLMTRRRRCELGANCLCSQVCVAVCGRPECVFSETSSRSSLTLVSLIVRLFGASAAVVSLSWLWLC